MSKASNNDQPNNKEEINWKIIVLTGFLTSLIFLVLDSLFVVIVVFAAHKEYLFVLHITEYFLLIEAALIIFWGACLGNIKQSVAIQKLKEKLIGEKQLNRYTIKEATLNSFTYYFSGVFTFVYLLFLHKIIEIIVNLSL